MSVYISKDPKIYQPEADLSARINIKPAPLNFSQKTSEADLTGAPCSMPFALCLPRLPNGIYFVVIPSGWNFYPVELKDRSTGARQ